MDTKSTLYSALYKEDLAGALGLGECTRKLSGKRVLIAGASGLVGTVLSDMILFLSDERGLGTQLVLLSRNPARLKVRYEGRGNVTLVSHDVNCLLRLEGRADYVVHLAANTHPVKYYSEPIETITTNVLGTMNLLNVAKENKASRFLCVSSVEIYGENKTGKAAFSEGDLGYIDCNDLRSGYNESKRLSECLCQAYYKQYGTDFVTARPARCYGATLREDDSKALSQFLFNAKNGHDIVLKSEGNQLFSYVYVADACSALLCILLQGESANAYNVADEKSNVRLKDLAEIVAQEAGTWVISDLPGDTERKGFSKATVALLDASKLASLGWRASFSIQEGVDRTLAMLRGE